MTTAFIFDFDGTLVDSKKMIYECFHSITMQLAPERINYAKNILIGPPLRNTASEILGPEYQYQLDLFVELFIQMHDEQAIKNTRPYPGVEELLAEFNAKKISMAIATNKRQSPTKQLINYYGWQDYFTAIECSDSEKEPRKKDLLIQNIIVNYKNFNKSYFVGDTVGDGLSSNINQIPFIKANYGYGKNQDWSDVNIAFEINYFFELKNIDLG